MKITKILFFLIIVTVLTSCSNADSENTESTVNEQPEAKEQQLVERKFDPVMFTRGQKLYQENCASCHGKQAEGDANWRKPDDDGKYPAPPLNGTGHTWHHSTEVLTRVIKDGTGKLGGNMPAWKDKLSDKDIEAILTWVKAQWPDELYSTWYNNFHSQ